MGYWEKIIGATPPIPLKVMLGHLPIFVFEKGLLGDYWRCSKHRLLLCIICFFETLVVLLPPPAHSHRQIDKSIIASLVTN